MKITEVSWDTKPPDSRGFDAPPTPSSDAPRPIKTPTPRSFFKKAPRLRPDLAKQAKVRRPQHKGKVVQITLSNGQTRLYPSASWAKLQGLKKGGRTTAARGTGHKFNSETGRKAVAKVWKRR